MNQEQDPRLPTSAASEFVSDCPPFRRAARKTGNLETSSGTVRIGDKRLSVCRDLSNGFLTCHRLDDATDLITWVTLEEYLQGRRLRLYML